MTYDPAADAFACHALWVALQRHAMLLAGDDFGRDDEVVDIRVFWLLRGAA